ncbi:GNAT family N-acetyltransferase [Paenibacillus sp. P26]|nr:GNAT family N-acetyltransferase [Paenibacillus sp. P26]
MFVNLKSRLNEPEVVELLEYSVFPDPDIMESTVNEYIHKDELQMYGIEQDGRLLGIVGFAVDPEGVLTVRHISVHPQHRNQGFGRGLILELLALIHPAEIVAETDEEAVDFYRNIGFEVIGLGEKYPGVERFRCVYKVDAD